MTQASDTAIEDAREWLALLSERVFAPLVERFGVAIRDEREADPFQRDPELIASIRPFLELAGLGHSYEVRGFENVPEDEPVLIVANHSGGALTLDPLPLMLRWYEARGCEAPIYGLTYDLLFAFPGIGPLLRRFGCLPASHENARRALEKGGSVIVFPGGDYEVFRPWKERNRICFGGRMGFIELALSAGVRVVPVTIHGAHESTFVLTRGHAFARRSGLDRLRVQVFPITWNIPFGLTPAFVPSLQLPSKITLEVGRPIDWSRHGPEATADPELMHACYEEVTGVMQAAMDRMSAEVPYPILARLDELRPSRQLARWLRG